ncbi:unnamed protein product [Caenorhabditis angaria]|uniref:ISXO2-like transposase domain-containing protein n=1 Tax=Caenorhabditis angaria TaxID=860376 RepID=A0A9P1J4B2_9PELO|nr:unnamed protein product [Caenorhabditis angaria]
MGEVIAALKCTADVDSLGNEEELSKILMNETYLRGNAVCSKCQKTMTLRVKRGVLIWRCRDSKSRDCSTQSVRKGSFFEKSKLEIATILKLVVLHVKKASNKLIGEELKLSPNTVIDFRNFLRENALTFNRRNHQKIGGNMRVVQIDESAFHSRKYGRGTQRKELKWFFGGVCAETRQMFGEFVPDRSARTLLAVLVKNVELDTVVHSDDWTGYRKLGETFAKHEVVVHSKEFVSESGVHTNLIEAIWNVLKSPLKQARGTSDAMIDGYLAEGVMRYNSGDLYQEKLFDTLKLD